MGVPTGNTYDKYGTTNPIERRLMASFFGRLDALLPQSAPGRVLEVGTGEGEVLDRMRARYPAAHVIGLDLPDVELAADVHGDAVQLPFPDDTFDLTLGIEVLEHLPDPAAALIEIARVTRPGGRVVLSVPNEPLWRTLNLARLKYVGELGNTPGHIQHWTPRRFVQLVGRWFDVSEVRRPVPWTMVAAAPTRR